MTAKKPAAKPAATPAAKPAEPKPATGEARDTPRADAKQPEPFATPKLKPPPADWADLTKPAYKDEIQMADPSTSGTAFSISSL